MNETSLTQDLMKMCHAAMRGSFTLKIQARLNNAGYPDMTHSWLKLTSWWEIKHYDNEPFKTPELQCTICRRLAHSGLCHYIIYEERKGVRRTVIVHPEQLDNWVEAKDFCIGFDHLWVCRFIANLHISTMPAVAYIIPL